MSTDGKIHEKLDRLDMRLDGIDLHLAKYNKDLEFHIARTNLLEDQVLPLVKTHEQWKGAGKLLMWASIMATIMGSIAWIWTKNGG